MVSNKKTGQIILHIIFILLTLACVLPFLLLVMSSFTSEDCLMQNGYSLFPKEFSTEAYQYLVQRGATIARGYGITFLVTFLGTSIALVITTMDIRYGIRIQVWYTFFPSLLCSSFSIIAIATARIVPAMIKTKL